MGDPNDDEFTELEKLADRLRHDFYGRLKPAVMAWVRENQHSCDGHPEGVCPYSSAMMGAFVQFAVNHGVWAMQMDEEEFISCMREIFRIVAPGATARRFQYDMERAAQATGAPSRRTGGDVN